jgi:hypothetical protein
MRCEHDLIVSELRCQSTEVTAHLLLDGSVPDRHFTSHKLITKQNLMLAQD